jgi:phosphoglycerate dehydrogenase-like enzyme
VHDTADHGEAIHVLVPDDIGMRVLADDPRLVPLRYDADRPDLHGLPPAQALVVAYPPDIRPTVELMHALPSLEYVQTLSAGYEQWLDGLPQGVRLTNVSGVHGIGVAEWVVAVLLAHVRELHGFAEAQRDRTWRRHPTDSLLGKRVTVLGAGDIAVRTRDLLVPFGCDVRLVGRTARDGVLTMAQYAADAGRDDVVVLALPVTDDTVHLVDPGFLDRLRDGAIVVNAGRGALVDTDALVAAASDGRIHGILDVVEQEPLPDDDPLWTSRSIPGVWDRAWVAALDNLRSFAAGDPPRDLAVTA